VLIRFLTLISLCFLRAGISLLRLDSIPKTPKFHCLLLAGNSVFKKYVILRDQSKKLDSCVVVGKCTSKFCLNHKLILFSPLYIHINRISWINMRCCSWSVTFCGKGFTSNALQSTNRIPLNHNGWDTFLSADAANTIADHDWRASAPVECGIGPRFVESIVIVKLRVSQVI
jgi:hypothetical protein